MTPTNELLKKQELVSTTPTTLDWREKFRKDFTHVDVWGSAKLHFLNEGNPEALEAFIAQLLEEQKQQFQDKLDSKDKIIERMMDEIRYLRSSQPERRKPIIRIKNGDTWYIPMITQAHDTPDGLYIEAELKLLTQKKEDR